MPGKDNVGCGKGRDCKGRLCLLEHTHNALTLCMHQLYNIFREFVCVYRCLQCC